MKPRIAIPEPTSTNAEYNERALPQYKAAIEAEGAEAVVIPAGASPHQIAKLVTKCEGVLLPGSPADVDPQKFGAERHPNTAPADPGRDNVDELLLQDAHNLHKPVLGICYGLQSLNVWRTGTLLQHIENTGVNHSAGRQVQFVHDVEIAPGSKLAAMLGKTQIRVNSSHHQSAEHPGDGLRVVATCPTDGIIEAVENSAPDHFVVAVQWHPERTYDVDEPSKALFREFVRAARAWKPREVSESVG
ncbi:MAG TPA: gamma-glutamyl-gamma-aminobutyrate hydrolase family protein [Terriglobales bacterium]|nr:gamma-glutamyl-gamma-aminobutyrate hydrolase family protein [Terriglobales bacterium]